MGLLEEALIPEAVPAGGGRLSLLFHRGVPWRGDVQGSTGILAERFLADGHAVAWMSRLRHLGHKASLSRTPAAYRSRDGAAVIAPFSVLPRFLRGYMPARLYSLISRAAYSTLRPHPGRLLRQLGQPEPDVIWTCGGDGGALRRYFPGAARILHVVDLNEAFVGPSQNLLEEADCADADAIVCIGEALAARLIEQRRVAARKVHVIGQGVDLARFGYSGVEPAELRPHRRPRLIWVGVLAKADPLLMRAALGALPRGEGSLILVGPDAPWAQQLAQGDRRVALLGPVPPERTPSHMMHCDVGLMLYDQKAHPLKYVGQNPLKLYEYAAAGLPIISTMHREYEYLRPPVLIAETEAEVVSAVRLALSAPAEGRLAAHAFALEHCWDRRYDQARALLEGVMGARSS